jgi:hypothetical protein
MMQFLRLLRELGLVRVVIGIVGLAIGFAGLISTIQSAEHIEWSLLFIAGSLVLFHLKRSDKTFFELYAERSTLIYQVEYSMMVIPIALVFLLTGFWQFAIGCFLVALAVPFIKIKGRSVSLNSPLQKFIPVQAIEWRSGVRKTWLALVLIWSLGLVGSYFIPAVPIAILLLGMLVSGFYEKMESLPILLSPELNPSQFLTMKIATALGMFSLICLPLIIVFVVFHSAQFYIPIIEFVLFSLLIVFAICVKYAFYLPESGATSNQVLLGIGFVGIFFPFILPVFLFFILRYYFKAKANLNLYLHDFN